jgi:hypothetical protein
MTKARRRRRVSDPRRPLTPIGFAWYEPDDYARVLEILNYPEGMTRSFERWREAAEESERSMKRSRSPMGLFPVRVVIKPDKLLAWCAARSIKPSRTALDRLVAEAAGTGTTWM